MIRSLGFTIILVVLSASASAADYAYQARMQGMVCAFCAYSVGKTLGALPGVDAESVHVDLDANLVNFHARIPLDRDVVSAAFADSGFALSALIQVDSQDNHSTSYQDIPLIELDLAGVDAERFEAILEAAGEFASTENLRLTIEAPEAIEIEVLVPILMGRKPALNVRFLPVDDASIRLKMYSASLTASQ